MGLTVSDIFFLQFFSHYKSMGGNDHRDVANLDLQDHGWQDLCMRPQKNYIHVLYRSALGYIIYNMWTSWFQRRFLKFFSYIALYKITTPLGCGQFGPQGLIGRIRPLKIATY